MNPITHAEVLDMLVAARGFIEGGWMKGGMHSANGRHCSLGGIEHALRKAAGRASIAIPAIRPTVNGKAVRYDLPTVPHPIHGLVYPEENYLRQEFVAWEAMQRLAAAIKGSVSKGALVPHVVISFNDDGRTIKADVLKAFDRAISRTRNRRPYVKSKPIVPGSTKAGRARVIHKVD